MNSGARTDANTRLARDHPPGEPARLVISRDKTITLHGALDAVLDIRSLRDAQAPPELRVLALAIGTTKLETALRRLGVTLHREVLTLDRIDGRLVWAVGDGQACLWLDREFNRLARIELGPSVIDDGVWAATLTYDEGGPGRGWYPTRVVIERNRSHVLTVHTASVTLKRR
jgi:hypothetical protein